MGHDGSSHAVYRTISEGPCLALPASYHAEDRVGFTRDSRISQSM